MNELTIDSQHIKVTPYAIEFDGSPSPEEWLKALNAVNRAHSMCQFYLGDLVAQAEYEWGSKYKELIEATGYEYSTLAHFANVSRRFGADVRKSIFADIGKKSGVSFSHFAEVAPLDDEHAFYFLEMCRDAGWTVAKLREEIARWQGGGALPDVEERELLIDEKRKKVNKLLGSMLRQVWVIDAEWVSVQIGRGNKVLGETREEIEA